MGLFKKAIVGMVALETAAQTAKKVADEISPIRNCGHCKARFELGGGVCAKIHFGLFSGQKGEGTGIYLCSDCAKRCPDCEKVFCPKHFKKHSC